MIYSISRCHEKHILIYICNQLNSCETKTKVRVTLFHKKKKSRDKNIFLFNNIVDLELQKKKKIVMINGTKKYVGYIPRKIVSDTIPRKFDK